MTKHRFVESEEATPMDFGSETEITQGQGDEQVDLVDEAIWGIMDEVVANGFSEASAEKKVRDVIEKLVKEEVISEVPEYEDPDGLKAAWISRALPSVVTRLRMNGDIL